MPDIILFPLETLQKAQHKVMQLLTGVFIKAISYLLYWIIIFSRYGST